MCHIFVPIVAMPRDGSIGAASLGARRDAPAPKRAPSCRSDERPLATQGDMLNSIKFQRRLRDTLHSDKISDMFHDKSSNAIPKDKPSIKPANSRSSSKTRAVSQDFGGPREKPNTIPKTLFGANRPSSPKGRRTTHNHTMSFY